MFQFKTVAIIAFIMVDLAVAQHYGAMMELGHELSPRYFWGPPQPVKRQSGTCGTGYHQCQDVGQPDSCCADDHYCYINPLGKLQCCAIDSACDNPCSSSQYLCSSTVSAAGTASVASSCCHRPCAANSAYQCAPSMGGGCCTLGYSCTFSSCFSTSIPPTTLVSIPPSGCTTGQFSCPSDIGGGCCNIGATCTNSGTQLFCASSTTAPSAIRTGPNGTLVSGITQTSPDSGLSTGAKTGIGIGIATFVCLIIAALLWFCMRYRAKRRDSLNSPHSDSGSGDPAQSMSQISRGQARPQGMADYFGPVARAGPYTDNESPGSLPYRSVPVEPNSPGDIVGAVEIGHSRDNSNITSPGGLGELNANAEYLKDVPERPEHRVELP